MNKPDSIKKKNPEKKMAMDLVAMMDYSQKLKDDFAPDYKREMFKAEFDEFRMEIVRKGYNINRLLYLGEEYKTLSFEDYYRWIYE
jgi:hypothetical protein